MPYCVFKCPYSRICMFFYFIKSLSCHYPKPWLRLKLFVRDRQHYARKMHLATPIIIDAILRRYIPTQTRAHLAWRVFMLIDQHISSMDRRLRFCRSAPLHHVWHCVRHIISHHIRARERDSLLPQSRDASSRGWRRFKRMAPTIRQMQLYFVRLVEYTSSVCQIGDCCVADCKHKNYIYKDCRRSTRRIISVITIFDGRG